MIHRVVMAVLIRNERILLCHRSPEREWYPDVWDLPGGHVEPGETPVVAMARELREELGIEVVPVPDPVAAVAFDDVAGEVWYIREWRGEVTNRAPTEHDEIAWFRLGDLGELDVADPSITEICRDALTGGEVPGG